MWFLKALVVKDLENAWEELKQFFSESIEASNFIQGAIFFLLLSLEGDFNAFVTDAYLEMFSVGSSDDDD